MRRFVNNFLHFYGAMIIQALFVDEISIFLCIYQISGGSTKEGALLRGTEVARLCAMDA